MDHFLTPVLALVGWTFIMWIWMYWKRIPAMNKITKNTQAFIDDPSLYEKMPKNAVWAADNYNHLHEQPVLFYALMFYIFLTNQIDALSVYCAWGYVGTRVLHSIVQVTSNKVLARFGLFVLGSLMLIAMTINAALKLV